MPPDGRRPAQRRAPQPRTGATTWFDSDDRSELARRLDASDCFCRDTRLGRLYHPNDVSYREITSARSLHVTLRDGGRVGTHVDRHSPLAGRQPGGDCRYSPLRIAAHNVSGMAGDLVRLALRRRGRRHQEPDSPPPDGLHDDGAVLEALAEREAGSGTATLPLTAIDVAIRRAPSARRWTVRVEAKVDGAVDPHRLAGAVTRAGDGRAGPGARVYRLACGGDGDAVVVHLDDADDDGRAALALLSDITRAYGPLAAERPASPIVGPMERTYRVPGISCDHCKNAIEREVGQLDGVDRVTVDVGAKTVLVAGSASDENVRAAIDEAGYEVAGTTP